MSRDSERPPLKSTNTSGSDTTPYDDVDDFQDVDGRRINPTKLVTFLKKTFNEGNYEVHRIHDIYSVRAPRRLSIDELQLCM
ncbi:hypothetical protein FSOLCH5_014376 [Fusarium solani]|uniref:Uncharacterized protein n=1 Tax=Fusarium solani TaxID=169388 RepID=A0A9P9GHQ8_FUSSL|nr:uncharacterized protein B0J15DRAFT_553625 [Fusarium solani]KAH7239665.1 hypothetical protein B0J15DRAFT_553625 [Fusarium solani]KAJ3459100.1 hypothetical protein MRS44_015173 [Fusarium solani]KAJ4218135.1 hypothetical protein NW759_008729 [Fusarium solani]